MSLRDTVFAALHASPFAGHSDYNKTYWRIAARYWWPGMTTDIRDRVSSCSICKAVNASSHEGQHVMRTTPVENPFDVVCLDVWSPGIAGPQDKPSKSPSKKLLTCVDYLTGYANGALINDETADSVTAAAFQHFFIPFGLPKIVIVDDGSTSADLVKKVCNQLQIRVHAVSKGNHRAILCERFHRYLNKVQKIHRTTVGNPDDWHTAMLLALYAWNAAPVDGTNITRSVAAIGREFPFPIEIQEDAPVEALASNTTEVVLERTEAFLPLLRKQQDIFRILSQDQRDHHRDLVNKNCKEWKFDVGDLVVVKVQVQSNKDHGPAKLQVSA